MQKVGQDQGGGRGEQQVCLRTDPQALQSKYENEARVDFQLPMNQRRSRRHGFFESSALDLLSTRRSQEKYYGIC